MEAMHTGRIADYCKLFEPPAVIPGCLAAAYQWQPARPRAEASTAASAGAVIWIAIYQAVGNT